MAFVSVFTTWRFSLSDPQAGIRRSNRSSATSIRRRLQLPGDLAHLVRLDDVAFLDVVEVLDADSALEPLGHLANVVLESAQRRDPSVVDDDPVADHAGARVAEDRAPHDVAACDDAGPGNAEQRTHLGSSELGLLLLWAEYPGECASDVVDRVVDHAV